MEPKEVGYIAVDWIHLTQAFFECGNKPHWQT